MEQSTADIIQKLTERHGPRPWWKNPRTLFVLWFSSHLTYFFALGVFKLESISLRASGLYVWLGFANVILTGGVFVFLFRHHELKRTGAWATLILLLLSSVAPFLVEVLFMGTTLHGRSASFMRGDFDCFWHATVSTVGPLLLFPLLFRHFFFARPVMAIVAMSFHLAFLASLLNELKCPDREAWHLVLGHQTPVIGVGLLLMGAVILVGRRRAFVRR